MGESERGSPSFTIMTSAKKDGSMFILSLSVFSAMLGVGIIVPLLPLYAKHLGATAFEVGMIFSGFSFARMVVLPVVGRLSDRHGRKPFLVTGLSTYALSSLGYIAAKTVSALGLVRFIHGFAAALVVPVAFAYIGDRAPIKKEGQQVGTFQFSLFLGMGLGPIIGGTLNDAFGMNANFLALGAMAGLAALMSFFGIKESKPVVKAAPPPLLSTLKIPTISGLMVFRFVYAISRGTIMAFLPLFATKFGNLTATQVGLVVSSNLLLSAVLQTRGGKLADRKNRVTLVLVGSLCNALIFFSLPFAKNFLPILGLNMLLGVAGAIGLPSASAMLVEEGRKSGMGQLFGMFELAMSAGIAIGPLMSGAIAEKLGVQLVFPFIGVVTLLGALIFYGLSNRSQSTLAASNTGPS